MNIHANNLRLKSKKLRRKPVTLIIGIVCKDGVVMAGDSQTTSGDAKSLLTNKMTDIDHLRGRTLIAESGATVTSNKVVELIEEELKHRPISNTRTVPEIISSAILKVREELRVQQFNCTSEELQEFIYREELGCGLMVTHYDDVAENPPSIYTIRLTCGILQKCKSFFETLGSGADMAAYLLSDLCVPQMDCIVASAIAVHVVEIVKQYDLYCGGPTKVGVLRHSSSRSFYPPMMLSRQDTEEIVQMVSRVEAETKQKRAEILRAALQSRTEKRMQELLSKKTPSPT